MSELSGGVQGVALAALEVGGGQVWVADELCPTWFPVLPRPPQPLPVPSPAFPLPSCQPDSFLCPSLHLFQFSVTV